MEEKNELNDLFLGEETKSGGSKKLFLIIAGALLVFFVTIGIMKFVNSSEDKTQNTNATKDTKAAQMTPKEVNSSDATAVPNDEKLNEIVRKLQEDAKNQASQGTPLDTNTSPQPKTTIVAVPTAQAPTPAPKVAPKPVAAPAPKAQPPAPDPAPAPKVEPKQVVAQTPKEVLKEAAKQTPAPAPKPVVAPKPKPAPKVATKPVVAPAPKAEPATPAPAAPASSDGGYYVQIGYDNNAKNLGSMTSKAVASGYKTSTRTAQVKDKNVTKVLAGPFNSKAEAQTELAKIKQQVSAGAFITK